MAAEGKPLLAMKDKKAFRAWMEQHHDTSAGVWLQLAKKGGEVPAPTYAEALEVALCFGWIDGQKGAIDAHLFKQLFTPRGPRSLWSTINRGHVARLQASGEMTAHGERAIARARENGQWERAYEGAKRATVPADLQRALAAAPRAQKFFATLDGANRYAILFRIGNVKKAETRARKIAGFVAMLARGEVVHPPRKKKSAPLIVTRSSK